MASPIEQPKVQIPPKKESLPSFYPCVFNLINHCPIRDHYKLRPESLVLFCSTCPLLYKSKKEMEYEIVHGQGITNPSGR